MSYEKSDPRKSSLPALRRQIDRIDKEVLRLLNERAVLSKRVGELKHLRGRPLYDSAREQSLLRKLAGANQGPLSEASVLSVFHEILRQSRRMQSSTNR